MYILFGRSMPPNSPKVTCNRSILSIFIAHYFLQVILICGINCGQTILLTGSMYIKLSFFPECPLADASINSYRKNYINTLKYFRNKYKSFFVSNFDEKIMKTKLRIGIKISVRTRVTEGSIWPHHQTEACTMTKTMAGLQVPVFPATSKVILEAFAFRFKFVTNLTTLVPAVNYEYLIGLQQVLGCNLVFVYHRRTKHTCI